MLHILLVVSAAVCVISKSLSPLNWRMGIIMPPASQAPQGQGMEGITWGQGQHPAQQLAVTSIACEGKWLHRPDPCPLSEALLQGAPGRLHPSLCFPGVPVHLCCPVTLADICSPPFPSPQWPLLATLVHMNIYVGPRALPTSWGDRFCLWQKYEDSKSSCK